MRYAAIDPSDKIAVSLGDTLIDALAGNASGSLQVYHNIALPINLNKGDHKLRFTNAGDSKWNLNWVSLGIPILPGYVLIPAKIEAEHLIEMEGVENEPTTDVDGNQHLHIDNNDWVRYWITVPGTGLYTLHLRVASASSASLQIEEGYTSGNPLGVTIPNTGGLQNWQTITVYRYFMKGANELTLRNIGTGSWNLNWIEFIAPCEYLVTKKNDTKNNTVLQTNASLNVYPNPTSQNFVLELNNGNQGKVKVDVLNIAGRVEKRFYLNKTAEISRHNLSLYGLASGQYMLQVQMSGYSETRKIVKL